MKKQPYESPKLELQWLLSEAVCANGTPLSFDKYDEDDQNELLPTPGSN